MAMNEEQWLKSSDPFQMIQFLELGRKGTSRKLRLFGVACCRRILYLFSNEKLRQIVEEAEGYADRRISAAQLRAAHRRSCTLCKKLSMTPDSPKPVCILSNAAVAINWVSTCDTRFRTNDNDNRHYPDGY